MNLLKKLMVAAGCAGAMGAVHATTFDAGSLTPDAYTNTAPIPVASSSFEDIYNFTITDFQTLVASVVGDVPTGTTLSDLSISLFVAGDASPLGTVTAGTGNQVDLSQSLLAGDYFLRVTGVADGSLDGSYQFSVAAVPEPAEWMMLLAGVAVLGFMARRKAAGVMAG